jgi:hypothetical protein
MIGAAMIAKVLLCGTPEWLTFIASCCCGVKVGYWRVELDDGRNYRPAPKRCRHFTGKLEESSWTDLLRSKAFFSSLLTCRRILPTPQSSWDRVILIPLRSSMNNSECLDMIHSITMAMTPIPIAMTWRFRFRGIDVILIPFRFRWISTLRPSMWEYGDNGEMHWNDGRQLSHSLSVLWASPWLVSPLKNLQSSHSKGGTLAKSTYISTCTILYWHV